MSKVIALIAALALFGAIPAVAAAQTTPAGGGDTVSSGNTQEGEIEQDAQGGGDAVGGEDGDARGGDGNAGNQAAICQQNAGGDANCSIDQRQNFGDVDGDGDRDHVRHGGHGGDTTWSHGGGVGGGGVQSVTLARTGFDAWVLALLGGVALAGGLGLLAAQRRGRLSA